MTSGFDTAPGPPNQGHPSIHVAHLIESLGSGGAERLLYTNLKHLPRERVRSTVITVFPKPDEWVENIRGLGVDVVSLDCVNLRDVRSGIGRMRAWLRRVRPSLVHSHLWAANVVGRVAGRLTRVPVISSIHNPDHEPEAWDDGSGITLNKRKLAREVDRWSARFGCERMIAVSDYVRKSAARQLSYPLDRIELIYNPIDIESFIPRTTESRDQVLGAHGIDASGPILLNVGRVSPQKGMLYAIQALPAILRSYPAARLISIGTISDRPWLSRLQDEARTLGVADRVHFLGPQKDVSAFLSVCDVFVFPSLFEGLGIALIEAMAMGCVCIASNVGPIPEVVCHGVNGWLVKPGDAADLAQAVIALIDDPARRLALGAAARESALNFLPGPAATRLMEVYESVLAGKPTGESA